MCKSDEILTRAGATMDEETGEMKVKDEMTSVAAHLERSAQFLGFCGSSGPSQVTCETLSGDWNGYGHGSIQSWGPFSTSRSTSC